MKKGRLPKKNACLKKQEKSVGHQLSNIERVQSRHIQNPNCFHSILQWPYSVCLAALEFIFKHKICQNYLGRKFQDLWKCGVVCYRLQHWTPWAGWWQTRETSKNKTCQCNIFGNFCQGSRKYQLIIVKRMLYVCSDGIFGKDCYFDRANI